MGASFAHGNDHPKNVTGAVGHKEGVVRWALAYPTGVGATPTTQKSKQPLQLHKARELFLANRDQF
jgi:hypothetical protein